MKINKISSGFTTVFIDYVLNCEEDKQKLYDIVRNRANAIGIKLTEEQVRNSLAGHVSLNQEHSLNLDLCGKE